MEEYVVRTSLTSTPSRQYVEEIVQLRSRVQASGTSVYTLAVLREWETNGSIPHTMVTQGFVAACLRSVCTTELHRRSPPTVKFVHSECVASLQYAQRVVTDTMTAFDNRTGMTQTFNQAAREYVTILHNNVWMQYVHWQRRAIEAEISTHTELATLLPTKSAYRYAVQRITQRINHATDGPDASRWKDDSVRSHGTVFADGANGDMIVVRLVGYLSVSTSSPGVAMRMHDKWLGVSSEAVVKSNISSFLASGLSMMKRVAAIRTVLLQRHVAGGGEGSPRLPKLYQIIPQMSYKTRSVTFGKEQTIELALYITRHNPAVAATLLKQSEVPDKTSIRINEFRRKITNITSEITTLRTRVLNSASKLGKLEPPTPAVQHKYDKLVEQQQKLHTRLTTKCSQNITLNTKMASAIRRAAKLRICTTEEEKAVRMIALGKRKRDADVVVVVGRCPPPPPPPPLASMTRQQIGVVSMLLFIRMFRVPEHLHRQTSDDMITVVTTDGVGASWHMKRIQHDDCKVSNRNSNTRKKKTEPLLRRVTRLYKNMDYGTHGEDVILHIPKDELTVISVDPGHATIINAIRYHNIIDRVPAARRTLHNAGLDDDGHPPEPSPTRDKRGDRRHAKARKLAGIGATTFDLKNTTWRDANGTRRYLQRVQAQQLRHQMQPVIDELAASSSRLPSVSDYMAHINAKMNTSVVFQRPMLTKARRRWRFDLYQTGQRAAEKLVTDLLNGVSDRSKAVVAWGNGSFGPTSRGHASAPNKALRTMLSRHVAVVLVDEYLTSKRCPCCETTVTGLRTEHYRKRHTVLRCDTCDGLWGRDMAASANIAAVLFHQMITGDGSRPAYLARG